MDIIDLTENEILKVCLAEQMAEIPGPDVNAHDTWEDWLNGIHAQLMIAESEPDASGSIIKSPAYLAAKAQLVELQKWMNKLQSIVDSTKGPLEEIKTFALDDRRLLEVVEGLKTKSGVRIVPEPDSTALVTALRGEISSLLLALGDSTPSFTGDVLTWDHILIERLNLIDKVHAEKVLPGSLKRRKQWDLDHNVKGLWKLWLPTEFLFASILAAALWPSVKAEIEREREKPAALVTLVHDEFMHLMTRNFKRADDSIQTSFLFPEESVLNVVKDAATIGSETLDALMVQKGIDLFGTVASHKVFRWQIFTGHKQALEGNPDPRLLRIDGGWDHFADMLGMNNKQAKQLEQIIEAQHATTLLLPGHDKPTRLLIREYIAQRGRNRAQIRLILGTALLPDYVGELKQLAKGKRDLIRWKKLVPICEMPPTIGRPNEHGAQATLSMLTVADFRDHAEDLVDQGGTNLMTRIDALAVKAGVPVRSVPAIIDRWENDGPDGPAFLKRVDGKLHTLGDAHKIQRDFIEEGGRKELQGSKAGKRGSEKRRKVLEKKGR